ncbi:hypothetical protein J4228_03190 [Candidatus Woesearchaeota archaeon]|nr:hypothetical protein [Candidatus Woesearchaeota archaeon]
MKTMLIVSLLLGIVILMGILIAVGPQGLTGAVVNDVACFEDADCNDNIAATEDICRNPGTEYSLCVNKKIVG